MIPVKRSGHGGGAPVMSGGSRFYNSGWFQYAAAVALMVLLPLALLIGLPRRSEKPRYDKAPLLYAPIDDVPNPFRKTAWLNGNWQFRLDGETDWRKAAVPHVWNSIPGLENYSGRAEYRIRFKVPKEWGEGRITLHFEGIAGRAEIFMNEDLVAARGGGFLPVVADVTDAIERGSRNLLEVRIDNRPTPSNPEYMSDERVFGGIFREVYIELGKPVYFDSVTVRAKPAAGGAALARVEAEIAAPPGLDIQIFGSVAPEAGGGKVGFQETVNADDQGRATIEWEGRIEDAALWSPERPARYRLSMVAIAGDGSTDGAERMFGVRKLKLTREGLYMNGKPLALRGVVWREQFPGGWGPVVSRDMLRRDFDLIREAGFNAVRLTHPAHPAVLDTCDRLGLIVFEELPFRKRLPDADGAEDFIKNLDEQMDAMFRRDGSRPSIVAWGIGRDLDPGDAATMKAAEKLAERMRALDPGRAVYAGLRAPTVGAPASSDFIAFTSYPGWTGGQVARFGRLLRSRNFTRAGRPAVVLGLGASANPDIQGGAGLVGSEQHQYYVISRMLKTLDGAPNAAGWFIDGFADYEGARLDPRARSNVVHTGIVTEDRKPKLVFELLAGMNEDVEWKWSRLPFRFPLGDFLAVALFALVGITIWSGFSKMWPAFIEPDLLYGTEGGLAETGKAFLMFGLPMLLAAGAAASFAASALLQAHPPDPAFAPESAIRAANMWLSPALMRIAAMFVLQFVWLMFVAALVSVPLGGRPLEVLELLSRCSALRVAFVVIPFFPVNPLVPAAVILGWEVFMEIGAVSRVHVMPPGTAAAYLLTAHAAAAGIAAAIAAGFFGSIGFLF